MLLPSLVLVTPEYTGAFLVLGLGALDLGLDVEIVSSYAQPLASYSALRYAEPIRPLGAPLVLTLGLLVEEVPVLAAWVFLFSLRAFLDAA